MSKCFDKQRNLLLRYYCPPTKVAEDNISKLSEVALVGSGIWGKKHEIYAATLGGHLFYG